MNDPLVSLLIPAYHERFFGEAFASALAQTYPNIEIVVCDDSRGSVIERIATTAHTRFPVRYERNPERLGAGPNLSRCYALARGEFVKFLNDDDLLEPECVRRLVDCLRGREDVALVTSARRLIDAEGRELPPRPHNLRPVTDDALIERTSLCATVVESAVNFIGEPSTTLFRRSALEPLLPDVPRFRGETPKGFGDVAMWFTLLEDGDAIYLVEPLSAFRAHEHQQQHENGAATWLASYRRIARLAADAGLLPPAVLERCLELDQVRPGGGTIRYRPLAAPADASWTRREISFLHAPAHGTAAAYEGPDVGSAFFSETRYLALNPDVLDADPSVEAETHALLYGAREGRSGVGEDLREGAPQTRLCEAPWSPPTASADGELRVCPHRPPVDNVFGGAWPERRGLAALRRSLLTGRPDDWCGRCPQAPLGATAALRDLARTRSLRLHGLFDPVVPLARGDAARAPALEDKILLVGHSARRAGGEMLLLSLMKELHVRGGLSVVAILLAGGELEAEYRLYGQVYVVGRDVRDGDELEQLLSALRADGYRRAICNTVVTGDLPKTLHGYGYETASLIHELPTSIRSLVGAERARSMARHADHLVFSAHFVRAAFEREFGLDRPRSTIIRQGVLFDLAVPDVESARADLRRRLGFPENARIALGIGVGDLRKGPDLFVEAAARCALRSADWHFVWIGKIEAAVRRWIEHDVAAAGLPERVRLLDNQSALQPFYAGADAFVLCSREDPFPNVMVDAMSAGLPVIAFEGAGGAPEVLAEGAGIVVPYLDTGAIGEALLGLKVEAARAIGRAARRRVESELTMERYAASLRTLFAPCRPTVSVIVPNYNYAQHIGQRLETIFAQTYPPAEIIVLDDASTDDSVVRIEALMMRSPVPIRLVRNERNSGSVFRQWVKGIRLAAGELVWVAEADDYCAPTLLESLAHAFCGGDTVLAYAQTVFVDADGAEIADGLGHTENIDADKWTTSYFRNGVDEIRDTLAIRNSVVNASAALFRRDAFLDLLADGGEAELTAFGVAGDWYAYVRLLEFGGIHFHCEPLNRQRRHSSNATSARRRQLFEEVLRVQKFVADRYPIDDRVAGLIDRERSFYFRHSGIGEQEGVADYRESSAFRAIVGTTSSRPRASDPDRPTAATPSPTAPPSAPPAPIAAKPAAPPSGIAPAEDARLYRRVENLFSSGKKEQARQQLLELADRGTVYWEVFNDLGVLAYEAGDFDAAVRYLSTGAGLELVSTNCLRNLMPVLVSQGELGQALLVAGNLLRREPDPAPALEVVSDLLKAAQPGPDGLAWMSPSWAAAFEALRGERDATRAELKECDRELQMLQEEMERIRNLRRPRSH